MVVLQETLIGGYGAVELFANGCSFMVVRWQWRTLRESDGSLQNGQALAKLIGDIATGQVVDAVGEVSKPHSRLKAASKATSKKGRLRKVTG